MDKIKRADETEDTTGAAKDASAAVQAEAAAAARAASAAAPAEPAIEHGKVDLPLKDIGEIEDSDASPEAEDESEPGSETTEKPTPPPADTAVTEDLTDAEIDKILNQFPDDDGDAATAQAPATATEIQALIDQGIERRMAKPAAESADDEVPPLVEPNDKMLQEVAKMNRRFDAFEQAQAQERKDKDQEAELARTDAVNQQIYEMCVGFAEAYGGVEEIGRLRASPEEVYADFLRLRARPENRNVSAFALAKRSVPGLARQRAQAVKLPKKASPAKGAEPSKSSAATTAAPAKSPSVAGPRRGTRRQLKTDLRTPESREATVWGPLRKEMGRRKSVMGRPVFDPDAPE